MADAGEKNRRRNKKKESNPGVTQGDGVGSSSAQDGTLTLQGQATASSRSVLAALPAALLPNSQLRRAGLEAGVHVLVKSVGGQCTVAVCESGGRDGSILLTPTVWQSLNAKDGEDVTIVRDFSALKATRVDVKVPSDLQSLWHDVMGSMQLSRYLAAVFEGTYLVVGDVRAITVNGQCWKINILDCSCSRNTTEDNLTVSESMMSTPVHVTRSTHFKISSVDTSGVSPSGESGGGASAACTATQQSTTKQGFSRVGGLRSAVEELKEAVQLPLERPELYQQLGVGPPRGVLLYGPPGTGKTLLARSLAEELKCPVELCSSADLVGRGIGESEDRIVGIFEQCRRKALDAGTGALLFIDEIDAICPKRDDSGESERRMVAALLTALDGVKGGDGIVVLGATNRPDSIDPALRRAGRLERELEIGVPNAEERREILEVHLAGIQNTLSADDCMELARRCHGYVGADLRSLCMSAARTALRDGCTTVDLERCLQAARLVPPSALKELLVEVPEVKWSDIGGYENTKEALREAVEWPIKHAWAFRAMSMDPPRGVLLYGPPGCSKTMMAKAVATETEMNFVSIKGPELFSKYVGDSERAVRDVFRKARAAAPCIIFFDEIDALGSNREGEGAGSVSARVLAQLLAEMDGVGTAGARHHVVVLAATNRPHVLDPALLRPGRFDRLVHVPLPDISARHEIFCRQLAKMRVSHEVGPSELANRTGRCSGAEVVMVCREAAMRAIRKALERATHSADDADSNPPCAGKDDFDHALQVVQPRIDQETVRFYEEFEQRTQHK